MSALGMIAPENRIQETDRFIGWVDESGVEPMPELVKYVVEGIGQPIYGPVLATNMEYMREHGTEAGLAWSAIALLTKVTRSAEYDYKINGNGERPLPAEFKEALVRMQARMAAGEIADFIPGEYAMTEKQGRKMAKRANGYLGYASSDTQQILSEANYSSYFKAPTMADGQELLAKSVEEIVESDGYDRMPHLVRSNYALGQLAGAFARYKDPDSRLVLWDQGTGSGATMARLVKEISSVEDANNIFIKGTEPNPDFYKQTTALINAFRDVLGSEVELTLEQDDVLSAAKDLKYLRSSTDVLAVDANYVWHRLPTSAKADVIDGVDEVSPNSIFYIADMAGNMSFINRHYFNFGNNGPLNAGNLDLKETFEQKGYKIVTYSDPSTKFNSVHPKLAEELKKDADNDGHFWVAYKGAEAERLVQLA